MFHFYYYRELQVSFAFASVLHSIIVVLVYFYLFFFFSVVSAIKCCRHLQFDQEWVHNKTTRQLVNKQTDLINIACNM